jgi:hypothetical protein
VLDLFSRQKRGRISLGARNDSNAAISTPDSRAKFAVSACENRTEFSENEEYEAKVKRILRLNPLKRFRSLGRFKAQCRSANTHLRQ